MSTTYAEVSSSVVATAEHVMYCFDALVGHYQGQQTAEPGFEDVTCPLFVTWNKEARSGDWRLRGCIGTLEPKRIHTALRDYALTSALRDRRFSPVQWKEVSSLQCTVSLLHSFEQGLDWQHWQVGTHGIIIEFVDPMQRCVRTATFLPEVAAHENWSKEYTLEALIRKAGYTGSDYQSVRTSVKLTKYQSTKCSLSFQQYTIFKNMVTAPVETRQEVVVQA